MSTSLKEAQKKIFEEINALQEENEKLLAENAELKDDIKWLIGYARATDQKIMDYFNDKKSALESHKDWLRNKPKSETFTRFFVTEENCQEVGILRRIKK